MFFGVWLRLVERNVRDVEVACSNHVTPIEKRLEMAVSFFMCDKASSGYCACTNIHLMPNVQSSRRSLLDWFSTYYLGSYGIRSVDFININVFVQIYCPITLFLLMLIYVAFDRFFCEHWHNVVADHDVCSH